MTLCSCLIKLFMNSSDECLKYFVNVFIYESHEMYVKLL